MTAPRRVGKTSLMMELKREPKPGWTVVYVDVEACTDAHRCITEIVDELLRQPRFKKYFQWTQLIESFQNFTGDFDFHVRSVSVERKPRANRSWIGYAKRVLNCIEKMANEDIKLLIIIDSDRSNGNCCKRSGTISILVPTVTTESSVAKESQHARRRVDRALRDRAPAEYINAN